MTKFRISTTSTAIAFTLALSSSSFYVQASQNDPRLNYAINAINAPSKVPSRSTNIVTYPILDASVKWDIFGECGQFDPNISIEGVFNGVTEGFRDYMDGLVASASAAVAGLPGLILKRVDPGLYDLVEEGMLSASIDFEAAKMDCQQMQDWLLGNGESPWQSFKMNADVAGWNAEMGFPGYGGPTGGGGATTIPPAGNPNIIAAQEKMEKADTGDMGVEWVCGDTKGGLGQEPINIVEDVVLVGYNSLVNRSDKCDMTAVPGSFDMQIAQHWPEPDDAIQFITAISGDEVVRTCQNCRKSIPITGGGVINNIHPLFLAIEDLIKKMVTDDSNITEENLNSVSARPAAFIDQQFIYEIRTRYPVGATRNSIIRRTAYDMAYVQLMERVRLSILIMRTGMTDPNVQANKDVLAKVETLLDAVVQERKLLIEDIQNNAQIGNQTISIIMSNIHQQNSEARVNQSKSGTTINSMGVMN